MAGELKEGDFRKRLFSYSMDGARWSVAVMSSSEEDARRRFALASQGSYDGILEAEIPVDVGLWVRALAGYAWQRIRMVLRA